MRIKRPVFAGFTALACVALGATAAFDLPPSAAIAVILLLAAVILLSADSDAPRAQAVAADRSALPVGTGRALLEQMPAALIVVSDTERLAYANPAARTLFPAARQGAHYSTLIRAPAFVDALDGIFSSRRGAQFSFAQAGPDPRLFEARATILPTELAREFGSDGQVIVLIEDRTRDKAMLDTRTDFIANASHELRTPLSSILGYIETLQTHAKDDPTAREMFLDIMLKQATRMKRLVDDLMSLSRIELNAHVKPDTPLGLHRVAAEAADALYPLASQGDVLLQIELSPTDPGPTVLADRDQLNQVMVNLIDNAIKYGGSGTKVRIYAADPDPRYPGMAGISVTDDGPGMAREHIPRVTERFYRVSTADSKDKGGTGLGLAITKHILARHSGALDIRSAPGEGSTFSVWIPAYVTAGGNKPSDTDT